MARPDKGAPLDENDTLFKGSSASIILDGGDTDAVRFERLDARTCKTTTLAETGGVFARDLCDAFEAGTGLALSIGSPA